MKIISDVNLSKHINEIKYSRLIRIRIALLSFFVLSSSLFLPLCWKLPPPVCKVFTDGLDLPILFILNFWGQPYLLVAKDLLIEGILNLTTDSFKKVRLWPWVIVQINCGSVYNFDNCRISTVNASLQLIHDKIW